MIASTTTAATTGPMMTPRDWCFAGEGSAFGKGDAETVVPPVQFESSEVPPADDVATTETSRVFADGLACQRVKRSKSWSTIK